MRSWLSNWKKRRESSVEAELRAARPEASARLVKAIANRVNPRPVRQVRTRTRIGFAAAVTACMVAVVGATGGFSSAASSISSLTQSVTHSSGTGSSAAGSGPISADAQYGAAPTVNDDFSPNPAWPGASVTVTGTNFSGFNQLTEVTVGGDDVPFQVTSDSSLVLTAPAAGAGGDIEVFNGSGHATTTVALEVVGAPTITHVATNGVADTAEGGVGSTVVITGTNFQTVETHGSVTFNKKVAHISDVNLAGTQITVTIPVGTPPNTLAKPGSLVVANPAGSASHDYVVDSDAPTIASIAVGTGKTFAKPGDTVIVTGKNLVTGTVLSFTHDGGGFVDGTSQSAVVGATAGTKWQAVIPTSAGAITGVLRVSNSNGANVSTKSLVIVNDPSNLAFSPNYGKAGVSSTKPGDKITITGSSLTSLATDGMDTVTFPGNVTAKAKPTGDTKLMIGVPFGATGSGPLKVDNGNGDPATSTAATFYVLGTPVISHVNTNGQADTTEGASGAPVVITGTGFVGIKTVTFNGKAAKFTVNANGTEIDTTVPVGATTVPRTNAGLVIANALGAAGGGVASIAYTVDNNAPTIKSVLIHNSTKAVTGAAAGDTIDISGTFLNLTPLTVSFGGVSATVSSPAPDALLHTISVVVPNGALTGSLVVDNSHGSATLAKPFTIFSAPTLVGFAPAYGIAGTKVTIQGANLAQVSEVDFQGTTAPGTLISAKPTHNKNGSITVSVPKGTTSAPIMDENQLILKVADPANSLNTSLTDDSGNSVFDIVHKPAGVTVNDLGNDHVAGQQIQLEGTNLQGITSVTFGKLKASFSAVAAGGGGIDTTKLLVTIPAGATSTKIAVANAAGPFTTAAIFPILVATKTTPTHALAGKPFTITGSGFKPSTLASVSIAPSGGGSSTSLTPAATSTDTLLKLTVPSLTPGGYTITIADSLGSVTIGFTID